MRRADKESPASVNVRARKNPLSSRKPLSTGFEVSRRERTAPPLSLCHGEIRFVHNHVIFFKLRAVLVYDFFRYRFYLRAIVVFIHKPAVDIVKLVTLRDPQTKPTNKTLLYFAKFHISSVSTRVPFSRKSANAASNLSAFTIFSSAKSRRAAVSFQNMRLPLSYIAPF